MPYVPIWGKLQFMEYIRKVFAKEYFIVALILMVGVCLSIWLGIWQKQYYTEKSISDFKAAAKDRVDVISDAVDNNMAVIRSLISFYNASDYVDPDGFHIYCSQLLKDNAFMQGVGFVAKVKDAERDAYEKQMAKTIPNFSIQDISADGKVSRAEIHEVYYPIQYVESREVSNRNFIGFNISSLPHRLETINKATETGDITATPKMNLLQKVDGVAIFAPIYKGGVQDKDKIFGFVSVGIPLDETISAAIKPLSPAGMHVIIHDETSGDPEPIYIFPSRLAHSSIDQVKLEYNDKHQFQYQGRVNFAGRIWRIDIIPARGYFQPTAFVSYFMPMWIGIAFTVLLALFLLGRINETRRITDKVNERTRQLAEAKRQTELILNSTNDIVIGIDKEGMITFSNPAVHRLLGYRSKDIVGMDSHDFFKFPKISEDVHNASDHIFNTIYNNVVTKVHDINIYRADGKCIPVDYICSPIVNEDNEVTGAVIVIYDIAEKKRYQQRLIKLASYDHLTGLANRSLFLDMLNKSLARSARVNTKVGVIYMDLNDFKPVNDKLGHAIGDDLLKAFAARIGESLRQYDTLARLGGDEFVILADNINGRENLEVLIERVIKLAEDPFVISGHEIKISVSIGAAIFPDDSTDIDMLISHADSAMYISKNDRSKKYVFFDENIKN